jgi:hypothetical protein
VDLYLFGLLAFEILTGRAAFPYTEEEEVLVEKIKRSDYEKPLHLTQECRDMIAKLIVANPK